MWLKENEFRIKLGGQTFINVRSLITFNGEPLFTISRREDDGQVAIDCEVFNRDGLRVASVKRNNIYFGSKDLFDVERSPELIVLRDKSSGDALVTIKKRSNALPLELDVSMRSYLPDGTLMDLGPDSSSIAGLFLQGNIMEDCGVGIAINRPVVITGKSFTNQRVEVDGKAFHKCTFDSCKLVFRGTSTFDFTGNNGTGTRFEIDGPALITIQMLNFMYQDPNLRRMVEEWITAIRQPLPPK